MTTTELWGDLRIVEVASLPAFHNSVPVRAREVFDEAVRGAVAGRRRRWEVWKASVGRMVEALSIEETEAITRSFRCPSRRRTP
jgi:hypothetical protein